jgi:hypothetical protein
MLTEFLNLRQRSEEPRRRWFQSADEDLIVWFGEDDGIVGFQLCYDRSHAERALTWRHGEGYSHLRVDDGEAIGQTRKSSPVLLPDGAFDPQAMLVRFLAISTEIPAEVAQFVRAKIEGYAVPGARPHQAR